MPVALDPRTGLVASVAYEEDIRQSILIILETAPGERVMRPNFGCGIHELVFAAHRQHDAAAHPLDRRGGAAPLRGAHRRARASPSTRRRPREGKLLVEIEYRVRKTNQTRQPRLPVLLPRGRPAMKPPRAPRLDTRRADGVRGGAARARARVDPVVGLDDGERDFGRALLEIAARFSSEVAERLDRARRQDAARLPRLARRARRGGAARRAMPVVFKLADSAREAGARARRRCGCRPTRPARRWSSKPRTDVRVRAAAQLRGRRRRRRGRDAFYLPPPGLTSLAAARAAADAVAAEELRRRRRDEAAARSGDWASSPEMLIEIGGQQYRVVQADKDIVTIDPPLDARSGRRSRS